MKRSSLLGLAAVALGALGCSKAGGPVGGSPAVATPPTAVVGSAAPPATTTALPPWKAASFERWRNASAGIYVPAVRVGNQTALNGAALPFAVYLNAMHNRIHPIFADRFLGSLDGLPATHPLNAPTLVTRLEVVLSPSEGQIVRMGIVRSSGITAFDVAALDSVDRAQPFGPAPGAIVSTDGNVYLHWELHRDQVVACSTMNVRPFLLAIPANRLPAEPPPDAPAATQL